MNFNQIIIICGWQSIVHVLSEVVNNCRMNMCVVYGRPDLEHYLDLDSIHFIVNTFRFFEDTTLSNKVMAHDMKT